MQLVVALLGGDLHQSLGDDGTCECGTHQILLVDSAGLNGRDDNVVDHLFGEVGCVELGSSGLDGLLLQPLQLIGLTHIAGHCDDFGIAVVLLQPGDDDGCIQTAGIGENDLLIFFLLIVDPSVVICCYGWIIRQS